MLPQRNHINADCFSKAGNGDKVKSIISVRLEISFSVGAMAGIYIAFFQKSIDKFMQVHGKWKELVG